MDGRFDEADPSCQNCGGDMVLRTARRGRHAGSRFWGASVFRIAGAYGEWIESGATSWETRGWEEANRNRITIGPGWKGRVKGDGVVGNYRAVRVAPGHNTGQCR